MTRTRIIAVLAVLISLLLPAAMLVAPADAATHRATSASSSRPKVGQCRTTTFDQAAGTSDTHKPVPCSQTHRMLTYAVANVPKKLDYVRTSDSRLANLTFTICQSRWAKALGSSYARRDQTAYVPFWFMPTKKQRKQGARWVRCDVGLLVTSASTGSRLTAMPNTGFPVVGDKPITDATRRCLVDSTHTYITICSTAHVARSDKTFTINSTARPTQATVNTQASTRCPGERTTYAGASMWKLGDHTVVCFTNTTS